MTLRRVTSREVRQVLLSRISSGEYPVGKPMPPLRQLALELGANRNTISKVQQELESQGLLRLVPGRGGGAFVQRPAGEPGPSHQRFTRLARDLIWSGLAMGLSHSQIHEHLQHVVEDVYRRTALRLKFLECNPHDAQMLGRELERALDCPIEYGLLDELADVTTLTARYDMVITTFHHIAETRRALGEDRDRVIGVNAVPSADVALRIALQESAQLGLICGRENTVQSMKYLVASYHPDCQLEVAHVDDVEAVRKLAECSQTLIVTNSCATTVQELTGRVPNIIVTFQIEAQSIAFLQEQIDRLHMLKVSAGVKTISAQRPETVVHT